MGVSVQPAAEAGLGDMNKQLCEHNIWFHKITYLSFTLFPDPHAPFKTYRSLQLLEPYRGSLFTGRVWIMVKSLYGLVYNWKGRFATIHIFNNLATTVYSIWV